MSYIAKVRNARCDLYDAKTRAFKGSFGTRVVNAVVQGDVVAVTCEDGRVRIYDSKTRAFKGSV